MSNEQEYITITEAAHKLGWNKATVYDWMKTLGMEKHKFLRNKNSYIHIKDFERIKEVKEKPWTAGPNIAKRDRNIAEKAKKQAMPQETTDNTKTPTHRPQKASTTSKSKDLPPEEVPKRLEMLDGTWQDVPEKTIFHYIFAKKFAIKERTLRDWIDKHEIEAMIGKNPNRPKQKYRLLTLSQQYKATQYLEKKNPDIFKPISPEEIDN